MKNKDGFTLIELAVVIMVLGILLGIMVPGVMNYMADAKAKECAVNRKAILLELDAKRVLNPGASLAEVIEAVSDSIHCPEQAVYIAEGNRVKCPIHGEDSTFSDEVENIGEVGAIDTEVVTEPEDKTESTPPSEPESPSEPSEPESPSEPSEPDPTEPEKPMEPDEFFDRVIADGELLRQSLHPELSYSQVSTSINPHKLYWMEMMDGSQVLCVGVSAGRWEGTNTESWTKYELARVDVEDIVVIEDYFVREGSNLRCIRTVQMGKIFFEKGNYYVYAGSGVLPSGDITALNRASQWVLLSFE